MQNSSALNPGAHLTVGSHDVVIKKFLSSGGFAHVYVVYTNPVTQFGNMACLKRVLVPNKQLLNLLRAEVDAMKRVRGHPNVVSYIDSNAARMADGSGYEVLLLMEYCSGHGLIDYMNQRLREQLKESEILKIMYDISQGLACMHYLKPPLIHRDLKIENVLISDDGTFKLCDFGSASPVLRPPRNLEEFKILDDDIQHHTTAQYRSPEMVDVYRGFPIDEKSDIWALGVFLYKLCYYTTPFEKEGQLAILRASFVYPPTPVYSDRLKRIIAVCLAEDPRMRPNIYQVLKEVCDMSGREVPIPDIYEEQAKQMLQQQQQQQTQQTQQTQQQSQQSQQSQLQAQQLPPVQAQIPTHPHRQAPQSGLIVSTSPPKRSIPEIQPLYRGRPKVETTNDSLAVQQTKNLEALSKISAPNSSVNLNVLNSQQPLESPTEQKYPTVDELSKELEAAVFNFDDDQVDWFVPQTPQTPLDKENLETFHSLPAPSKQLQKPFQLIQSQSEIPPVAPPRPREPPQLPNRPAHPPIKPKKLISISDPKDALQQTSPNLSSLNRNFTSLPRQLSLASSQLRANSDEVAMSLTSVQEAFSSSSSDGDGDGGLRPTLSKREPRRETKLKTEQARNSRDSRGSRDSRDSRDSKDSKENRDSRDFREAREQRDSRDTGEPEAQPMPTFEIDLISDSEVAGARENERERERVPSGSSELKAILTGMSERDQTEVELKPDNHIDSGVDFLKTLDKEHTGHSLRRISSSTSKGNGSRAASSSTRYSSGGGHHHRRHTSITNMFSKHSQNNKRHSSYLPGAQHSKSTDSLGSYSSYDEDPVLALPPRPKTSHSLHSRVQHYLQGTASSPPRRTAEGYGRYTDSGAGTSDDDSITSVRSTGIRNSSGGNRPLSGISRTSTGSGGAKGRPPAVPKKPSHLQSPRRTVTQPASTSGKPLPPSPGASSSANGDDWETTFNKKYPSLI